MKSFLRRVSYMLLFVGALMLIFEIINFRDSKKTVHPYDQVLSEDIKAGIIMEGELHFALAPYMESYTTTYGVKSSTSDYYYIIPVGDDDYMGFQVKSTSDMGKAMEALVDDTHEYLFGNDEPHTTPVAFKAKVKSMSKEDQKYFRETMQEYGLEESEIEEIFLPYYLELVADEGEMGNRMIWIAALLLSGIVLFFLSKEKEIHRSLKDDPI